MLAKIWVNWNTYTIGGSVNYFQSSKSQCNGLKGESPKGMSIPLFPEPMNGTLFGKRVFADIIN